MLSALLLLSQTALPASSLDREWVVRDVVPGGVSTYQNCERRWMSAKAFGDLDEDGASDFLLQYQDFSLNGGYPWEGFYLIQWAASKQYAIHRDREGDGYNYFGGFSNIAFSESPIGYIKTMHAGVPLLLRSFDLANQQIARSQRQYPYFYRVRDMDGDGYDELFAQSWENNQTLAACLDGRTLSERWSVLGGIPSGLCALNCSGTRLFEDFDGDGVEDFLSVFPVWLGGPIDAEIRVYSGVDGHLIWGRDEPDASALISASIVPDVTGDGVREIAFSMIGVWDFAQAHFEVLDGASGSVLWVHYTQNLGILAPDPGFVLTDLDNPVLATDSPTQPGRHQLIVHCVYEPIQGNDSRRRALHLDLRTGVVLGWAQESLDCRPWYPDPLDNYYQFRYGLGDVDRDGLTEIGVPSVAYSMDIPGNGTYYPWHFVITGQRTLFQPAAARPGEELEYRIAIPGAPGHDYELLLSFGFDRDGGERVDGWKTHLVDDVAFQATRAGRFSGRLDASGAGLQRVRLPASSALSGKTLYAKTVVWKPGSSSEVWTQSSLGITAIR